MSRLFGPRVGLLSGFVQATVVYQVMYSRLAEADVVLQACVLAAIAVFVSGEMHWESLSPRQRTQLRLAWWVLLGAMNLVKGIAFGAVLTLLTCAGWFLLRGDWWGWRRWWSPVGMLLAALIATAWPVAVAVQEPAALALWQQHFFGRAAGSLGYTQPWWYYLTTWPTQLLPWLPFLFVALPQVTRTVRQDRASPEAFCLWWAVSQITLLSCSSGKHHHYLIYALPALTPLMAKGLLRCGDWLHDPSRNWRGISRRWRRVRGGRYETAMPC
jgi:4-amino-4-deoxy-L-arabinose transferase-like glycosyltransferase